MENFDQLIDSVKSHLQPEARALAAISLPHVEKHRCRIKRETIEALLGGPLQGRL